MTKRPRVTKSTTNRATRTAAKAEQAADQAPTPDPRLEEAAILLPDRDLVLNDPDTGEEVCVTVREFRFREGLKVQATARALIEDLAALVGVDGGMTPARVAQVLGAHGDLWLETCAISIAREADWIARLREPGAGMLTQAVWEVNADFFTARLLGQHLGRETMGAWWASLTSSQSLQAQDTGDPVR